MATSGTKRALEEEASVLPASKAPRLDAPKRFKRVYMTTDETGDIEVLSYETTDEERSIRMHKYLVEHLYAEDPTRTNSLLITNRLLQIFRVGTEIMIDLVVDDADLDDKWRAIIKESAKALLEIRRVGKAAGDIIKVTGAPEEFADCTSVSIYESFNG